MGKNRRRKIANILRKAKERRKAANNSLADPQTVSGQSLCTVDAFDKHVEDTAAVRSMKEEEVFVANVEEPQLAATKSEAPSWFATLTSYFW